MLAPPSLLGEGNKVQHSWLFNFLKNGTAAAQALHDAGDQAGHPHAQLPILDQEATDIAAYFAAASNHESTTLKKQLLAINKYREERDRRGEVQHGNGQESGGVDTMLQPLISYAGALIAARLPGRSTRLTKANEVASKSKAVEQVSATTKPVSTR